MEGMNESEIFKLMSLRQSDNMVKTQHETTKRKTTVPPPPTHKKVEKSIKTTQLNIAQTTL